MLSTSLIDLEKDTLENYIGINSDKSHIKDKWVFRGYKIYMYKAFHRSKIILL